MDKGGSSMKSLFSLILGVGLVLGGSAAAQDAPAAERSWAGPYAGLLLGVSTSAFCNASNPGACPPDFSDPPYNHFVIGGIGGYNIQVNSMVFSLEAAVVVDMPYRFTTPGGDATVGITRTFLRARTGYAFSDNTLVYATIGLAGLRHFWTNGDPEKGRGYNLTVGAGVEVRGNGNWSLRIDYAFSRSARLHQARFDDPNVDLHGAGHTITFGIIRYFGR